MHKVSERATCRWIGITPKTIQNWRRLGNKDRRKGSARHVPRRFSPDEEQALYNIANDQRFKDQTAEQIVAKLAEEGIYLGSPSTLYRVLKKRKALEHRQESKKPGPGSKPTPFYVTASNQVWAWDITWLKTDVKGLFKYAYTIIDLFDRTVVGWSIEDNESDEHALYVNIVGTGSLKIA